MNFTHYLQELQNNLTRGSERTHYPALKNLVDSGMLGIITTIEETGNQAGIPDFTVRKNDNLVGYIEAKKIGENLDKIEEIEQFQRYFGSAIGENLILTNYLEFRWYLDGKLQLKITLAKVEKNKLLMTPYTIAHLKLALLLENLGYRFEDKERLNIYLTNALEEGVKKSEVLLEEYKKGWSVKDIFPVNSTGVKTHRDHFVIDFDSDILRKRIENFRNLSIPDEQL